MDHIHQHQVSVREHAALLRVRLAEWGAADFSALVADCEHTVEIVARFLALLELFPEKVLAFEQEDPLATLWCAGSAAAWRTRGWRRGRPAQRERRGIRVSAVHDEASGADEAEQAADAAVAPRPCRGDGLGPPSRVTAGPVPSRRPDRVVSGEPDAGTSAGDSHRRLHPSATSSAAEPAGGEAAVDEISAAEPGAEPGADTDDAEPGTPEPGTAGRGLPYRGLPSGVCRVGRRRTGHG
ncbi:segregation/condensation protein A [Saccharopolyspora gregorii]|uniref:Uncharacterized protein n=1 Tax=Saccharopolyspora gregorii TaxID=33914 RepID=A0ABP6S2P2_9PSEU